MNADWPLILTLVMLGVMMWSSFVWRRKFMRVSNEADGLRTDLAHVRGNWHRLKNEVDEFKQSNREFKAQNILLRQYVRTLEGSRVKTDDRLDHKAGIYGVPDQPCDGPHLGMVTFDIKSGRWHIT